MESLSLCVDLSFLLVPIFSSSWLKREGRETGHCSWEYILCTADRVTFVFVGIGIIGLRIRCNIPQMRVAFRLLSLMWVEKFIWWSRVILQSEYSRVFIDTWIWFFSQFDDCRWEAFEFMPYFGCWIKWKCFYEG